MSESRHDRWHSDHYDEDPADARYLERLIEEADEASGDDIEAWWDRNDL